MGDKLLSDRDRNYFLGMGTLEPGDHEVTLDQRDASLATATNDIRASHPRRSMSESRKMEAAVRPPEQAFAGNQPLSSHARGSHAMANGTLALAPQELAATIAARIASSRYQNKQELLLAVQAQLSSLDMDSIKSQKRNHMDSPSRNATNDPQKEWKCQYCDKTKKTQCELKYHSPSPILHARFGASLMC